MISWSMTTKLIYFTVNGREEKAEFCTTDSSDDIKELFRSAAEAGPHDILKLYNKDNSLVCISPSLEPNSPNSLYYLVVVAMACDAIAQEMAVDIEAIEQKIQTLEKRVLLDNRGVPDVMSQVRAQLEALRCKIEGIEHLSWLGLSKELPNGKQSHTLPECNGVWKKQVVPNVNNELETARVFEKFHRMSLMEVSDDVKQHLRKVDFNNWQWEEPEMLVLLQQMYTDLGFLTYFTIPRSLFHNWLCEIYTHYNRVPFHNFKHCFMVTQMMYGLISLLQLHKYFDVEELFALLTSAVCHDLDHPGYNNAYQINAKTELALRYNDISPLENHHSAITFKILCKEECNILKSVNAITYKRIRESVIRCILATDMARHSEILNRFKAISSTFDYQNRDHRDLLMMILIKCADISNECRPMEVAEPWIDCLLQEFFTQSDLEKTEGLPVSPFMDREKVNKNSSQINFISFVLLPLFEALAELFPQVHEPIIAPLQDALQYYKRLAEQNGGLLYE